MHFILELWYSLGVVAMGERLQESQHIRDLTLEFLSVESTYRAVCASTAELFLSTVVLSCFTVHGSLLIDEGHGGWMVQRRSHDV